MKLELEISDELWKRIEHRASLFNRSPNDFLVYVLENRIPLIPDPIAAEARIAAIRAEAGPEDDYDMDELLRQLEINRGRIPQTPVGSNGAPR